MIIHVCEGLFPDKIGGIQKYSRELILTLNERGVNQVVITPFYDEVDIDLPESINVYTYKPSSGFWPFSLYEDLKSSDSLLRNMPYNENDVIFFQGVRSRFSVKSLNDKRVKIVNFHGLEMFQSYPRTMKEEIARFFLRRVVKKSSDERAVLISLGGDLTRIIKKHLKYREIHILPNGLSNYWLNTLPQERIFNDTIEILFVGRKDKRKNLDLVLDFFEKTKLNVRLNVVGTTGSPNSSNIIYYGAIRSEDDMRSIYLKSHLLLAPSLAEGMPTVILEAMACGLPVIATNVGANEELVCDRNGWLVDINSDLSSALNGILRQLEFKPDILDAKGTFSSLKSKNFCWNRIADDFLGIINI